MQPIWRRAGVGLAAAVLTLTAASTATAATASGPVQARLTITPSTTTVGTTVTVVGTATNTTSGTVSASLGINNYSGLRLTSVSGSAGCRPRNVTTLIYCGIQSLPPGATARITITLAPAAGGTYSFRCYARVTYTTDDTYAYGSLVVS